MTDDQVAFERVGRHPRLSDTIADKLLEAVVEGRFKAGDLLPSERELGEQFGVVTGLFDVDPVTGDSKSFSARQLINVVP